MSFTLPKLLRLSSLTLAISLPSLAYAESGMPDKIETEEKKPSFNQQSLKTETITVTATGNPRDTFSTPMMITVIDRDNAKSDTASSAADILLSTPGITIEGVGSALSVRLLYEGIWKRRDSYTDRWCAPKFRYRTHEWLFH